jgi:two-component system, OmpR family, phosphate regulon response regulator PhoB
METGRIQPSSNESLAGPLSLTASAHLDVAGQRLFLDGREEPLSPLRFEILRYLVERPGRLVTARDLVRARILGAGSEQRYRGIVKEIRDRLGPAHAVIRTVRGAGYRFDPPERAILPGVPVSLGEY